MSTRSPSRLRQDLTALLACAGRPLDASELARALDVTTDCVTACVGDGPRCARGNGNTLELDPAESARRHARLPEARRSWAHELLARASRDPVERARHACLAGLRGLATKLVDEALAIGAESPRMVEMLRAALDSAKGQKRRRHLQHVLARSAWQSGLPDEAERTLVAAKAQRSRDPDIRLLWAQIHNRRGRFQDALALTRGLLRRGTGGKVSHAVVLDVHARNLLWLGQGDEAVRVLDAHLSRPGPTTTFDDLNLHLTRQRCAREAAIQEKAGLRLLDLARLVREGRRRKSRELEAKAAWAVAIALSDAGNTERSLHWGALARSAWLDVGDEYRAADVENSLGIFLHKLGRIDEAIRTFGSAIERLQRLDERHPLAVVHMNLADLKLDLLDLVEARRALAFCRRQDAQGVLRFKSELMTLECHLLAGAAPDLLLEHLDELRRSAGDLDRPAVHAYFHALRGRILRRLGRVREACSSFELAIATYERTGNDTAAAEMLVWWASLQHDRSTARSAVAKAVWRTRHRPQPFVEAARRILGNRPGLAESGFPLQVERMREISSEFEAIGKEGVRDVGYDEQKRLLSLANLVARTPAGHAPPDLDAFGRKHLGTSACILWHRGPVGSLERVAGPELDRHASIVEARGIVPQTGSNRSLCVVESPNWILALVHDEIELRFGHREHELAKRLLELIEVREQAGDAPPPATQHADGAFARAKPYEPDGVSMRIRTLRRDIAALAKSELPIVIEGPTGSGKDRLAKYVHHLSNRAAAPFVVIDCGTLHETLAESELFGYVKGAFTGAEQAKSGLLEVASGGTLVLDDPAALGRRIQGLLVHVLERGRIRRLGDGVERKIDVRVLTLLRRPIETEVEQGNLRPELFYRIYGAKVVVPSLAERREDLPLLVSKLIQEENAGRRRAIERTVLDGLAREPWPGNLRELRSRIQVALLLEPGRAPLGRALRNGSYGSAFGSAGGQPTYAAASAREPLPSSGNQAAAARDGTQSRTSTVQIDVSSENPSLAERLRCEERRILTEALSRNGGHRERTARDLGISRRWLQKRIKELEIQ